MSGSLLLIVAVWLVLLAPLLLRNQRPVRRTAQALSDTRVLHSGGAPLRGRRKLRPAPGLYREEDDEELELVDAEPEYVLLEDPEDIRPEAYTGATSATGAVAPVDTVDAEVDTADSALGAEAETVVEAETEVVAAEDDQEKRDSEVDQRTERPEANELTAEVTDHTANAEAYHGWDDTDTGQFAPVRVIGGGGLTQQHEVQQHEAEAETGEEVAQGASTPDATDGAVDNVRQRRFAAIPRAYIRGGDIRPRTELRDEIRTTNAHSAELALYEHADELNEADLAYLASRRGRGVYDPVASQALVARRLKRRKQVLLVLIAAFVLTLVLGFLMGGAVWFAPALTGAFTVFYLVVLRKQAIEEKKLRQRRMARMRRARMGVRNTEDDELGVPDRLQRPGAVIMESDDLHPEFEHLDYVDGSRFFAEDDPYQLRHA